MRQLHQAAAEVARKEHPRKRGTDLMSVVSEHQRGALVGLIIGCLFLAIAGGVSIHDSSEQSAKAAADEIRRKPAPSGVTPEQIEKRFTLGLPLALTISTFLAACGGFCFIQYTNDQTAKWALLGAILFTGCTGWLLLVITAWMGGFTERLVTRRST